MNIFVPSTYAELAQALSSTRWRLENLYRVIDENGHEVPFVLRDAQAHFLDNLHYFNLILKARQLGFTTLIDIFGLDMTIFTPNFRMVIIAETREKGADIFQNKILFPYEHLPQQVRSWCKKTNCTAAGDGGELRFSNGSSIEVMTSARSGTVNFLHVTEYGVICAKQPAKAMEIKTGSFPAVHLGNWCFVESTAMGRGGDFYDLVQQAQKDKNMGRILAPIEFKLHFYAWWQNQEYALDTEIPIPDRLEKYFQELKSVHGIELSPRQKAWYVVKERIFHEKMWAEYPSYPDEAFKVAQDGAYYGRQFEAIYRENRITRVPYEPALPVYTAWDLGVSDDTSIWFLQFIGREVRAIDYYEASGEGLSHYAGVLLEKGYRYGGHYAPHDIEVREFTSGISRRNAAAKLGINFTTVPTNADLLGGIEAVRQMLVTTVFDAEKCEAGITCLESYKKDWDEKHGCYRTTPLHDASSHGADSMRTAAVARQLGMIPGIRMDAGSSGAIKTKGGLRR